MSTSDYRRLATIIRENNPKETWDNSAMSDYTRWESLQAIARAYDTLADELETELSNYIFTGLTGKS